MLAIIIILAVVVVIELIICFVIHADRKKTHNVYLFMAEMVANEGGALQQALEELKSTSKYAEPAESAAAIGEIIRFLDSFNTTVRKQVERIEEGRKHKWHEPVTGIFKKKKATYTPPVKKKAAEKKEPEKEEPQDTEETQEDAELAKIEEKVEKKLAQEEDKPKKVKKLKRRIKRIKPGAGKKPESPGKTSEPKTTDADEKKSPGDGDTDIDLAPPPEGE